MPRALAMMAVSRGDSVLDLACGQGVFSRYLMEKGMNVCGLDSSSELIHLSRSRSPGVRMVHADAGDAKALLGETFDAVACILAIQNMETPAPALQNVARWLKPDGRFVMVVTHPCFRIPRQTHWGWDDVKKMEYRRVDLYASEMAIPILTPPMADPKSFTMTYHRSLETYFLALSAAGLAVDALEEWVSNKSSQPGSRSRAENRARREIPMFLALRARPFRR